MRNRSNSMPAVAAFALLIALDCLCAGASAHAKTGSHKRPQQLQPPPTHLIRCAAPLLDGSPCGPDPAMLRMNQDPWRFDAPPDLQFGAPRR